MDNTLQIMFNIQLQNTAALNGLVAQVNSLQSATVASAAGLSSLENSIKALTAATITNTTEVLTNTAALANMGTTGAAAGAQVAGGMRAGAAGARELTNEMRVLEGAMPIRAAAHFLTQIPLIAQAGAVMFPVFGAVALVGVLDQILTKTGLIPKSWDEVSKAQEHATEGLRKYSDEAQRAIEKLAGMQQKIFTSLHGPAAGAANEAGTKVGAAEMAPQRAEVANRQLASLQHYIEYASAVRLQQEQDYAAKRYAIYTSPADRPVTPPPLSWSERLDLMGVKGFGSGLTNQYADVDIGGLEEAKNELPEFQARARAANAQLRESRGGVAADALKLLHNPESEDEQAERVQQRQRKAAEEARKAAEEAKKRQEEINRIVKQGEADLRSAQTFELAGLQKVDAAHQNKIAKLNEEIAAIHNLAAAERDRITAVLANENTAYGLERQREAHRLLSGAIGDNANYLAGVVKQNESAEDREDRFGSAQFQKSLKAEIAALNKSINAGTRSLERGDQSDADAVARQLGVTVRGNAIDARNGATTPGRAADADRQARIAAANQIFDIESRHLDLIEDEGKREEKLAGLRKKNADEIYRANEQYEIQFQDLREKDLQKYRDLSGQVFDALKSHSMNQFGRSLITGQEKILFENATSGIFQQAGHALGGLTGGANPMGLLTGTFLDPANGDNPAKTTADNTKRTWEELVLLKKIVAKAFTGNADPTAAISGGPGSTSGGLFNLPNFSNPLGNLGLFASDLGGFTGTGGSGLSGSGGGPAGLLGSYGGSGLSQMMAGLGAGGNNPLGAIFTGQASGNGWGAQLTGAQQAGVAVGTAAMLAGAGLSIASGISQGGVAGYGKAAASGLGVAALVDPEPISKMVLGIAAGVTGLVTGMFSTGPQQRAQQFQNDISKNQYLAPTALNVMQGMNGTYESFDARGNLMTSTMSAVPTVAEPYITKRVINGQQNWYDAPGAVDAPYSGGAKGTGIAPTSNASVVVNVAGNLQAMDSQSFHQFVTKPANAAATGDAITQHLQGGGGERLASAMRFHTNA